ncbi:MAG: TonB-dependent receptor [Bacteroidales bacterium]|nr:TonB-dependent receptor [Bacteroidales bacterium]
MKRFYYLILFILIVPFAVFAEETISYVTETPTDANISGHVLSLSTKEHLPYIIVEVKGTSFYTKTDRTGHYFFRNLPVGNYVIEVSGMGYKSESRSVEIIANKTQEINFSLEDMYEELEQIVVSANRGELKRQNASSMVNILTSKTLDLVSAPTLSCGLNYQPGIRVEDNCQNCGFMQVRINGLDGHYSQILMNSRPIFSALTGVYGLEQIPSNMIERVEVIRGGGSALFGSSAIGGTINIITKEPTQSSAEVSHSLTSIGISNALDNNTTFNASLVNDNYKMGLTIYGQSRKRDYYDHDGDGFCEIPEINGKTVGLSSYIRTGDFGKVNLQYHSINEFRRGGDAFDLPPHEAMIAEQTDHTINGGELSYDLFFKENRHKLSVYTSFQTTKRDSYYGAKQDPNAYGKTSDVVSVTGAQYSYKFDKLWFLPSELMVGGEYSYNKLIDNFTGYDHYVKQKVNIGSVFLQNEWRDDKWGFLVGVRMDKHNLVDKPIFSPRINLRYNPIANVNLRLTYSSGFRAPQAFDEDFHVAVVGGDRVVTVLDPNLKEERSNSLSFSADMYKNFGRVRTNLMVELFYTDLKDAFALRKTEEQDAKGNTVMVRYNGSGARVAGGTIEGKIGILPIFQIQGSATIQYSGYKELEYWSENPDVPPVRRMFRSPNAYGYIMGVYNPIPALTLSVSGTATGAMMVQHCEGSGTDIDRAERTSPFFDANFKVAYDFKIWRSATLQLNAAIMNIFNSYQKDFDQGPDRDSGYIYGPALPRSITVGVKVSI